MIEARQLSIRFRPDRLALDDVSFRVEPGEVFALLGARGAGKTTVVNAFRGVIAPDKGAALVEGCEVLADPLAARRRLGFVVGPGALYGDLSPRQNARLFALAAGRSAAPAEIDTALRTMGVPDWTFDVPAGTLEPGMYRSVSLATALLRGVGGLVLDEPADGVDQAATPDLDESLDEFCANGTSVLLATTDLPLAAAVADRVGILRAGRLVVECTPKRLLEWSLPEFLLEFAGTRPGYPRSRP